MFRHLSPFSSAPAQPAAEGIARGANRLTGVRQEIKFLMDPDVGARVLAAVEASMPAKIVDGRAFSHRVSAYLDAPDHELTRQGLARGSQALKLRVKEYYHMIDGALRVGDRCWLEVKARLGAMVEKSRFVVAREDVLGALQDGPPRAADPEVRAAIESFEAVRRGRPLRPVIVSHYTRWTYQDPESKMRITLDKGTSFHMPPRGLYTPAVPTGARVNLPPPLEMENRWIMEVKSIGAAVPWLEDALAGIEPADYSKFVAGLRAAERRGLLPV
jgi:hypothetical protein